MIPYAKQDIDQHDISEVVKILKSNFLTQGPAIPRFENTVKKYCSAKYATAVSSGTAALHIACQALGLQKGDTLWTSPITFVASANCALYCGATVDFVDIDPRTYNMSVAALEKKLIDAKKKNKLPKIVIPVHLAGQSCEMKNIFALSKKYKFKIIEDASHAIGATYRGKNIGSCQYSHATVLSFHPVKIITTGEGGMIVCNDEQLHKKVQNLRTHGITRDEKQLREKSHGPWYYEQLELGYNYRITDIQAALGASQMIRLKKFLFRRRFLAKRYDTLLKNLPLMTPYQHPDTNSSWHLYIIRLDLNKIRKTHKQVFEELRKSGIGVNLHYIPVYLQPYYRNLGFKKGLCPESERYYSEAISLPMYYSLKENEQNKVIAVLKIF